MDAVEFVKERNRMCKSFGRDCCDCPADKDVCCDAFEWQEELVAIVEKWSAEHPCKTRQSEFLKQYPNAKLIDGILAFCPKMIDTSLSCPNYNDIDCLYCRREFWMEEIG